MTGEMARIDKRGHDSNGDTWPIHASIARQLGGELRPFDVYQGPYIIAGGHKLWLGSDDGVGGYVYDETTGRHWFIGGLYDRRVNRRACAAARGLIAGGGVTVSN